MYAKTQAVADCFAVTAGLHYVHGRDVMQFDFPVLPSTSPTSNQAGARRLDDPCLYILRVLDAGREARMILAAATQATFATG